MTAAVLTIKFNTPFIDASIPYIPLLAGCATLLYSHWLALPGQAMQAPCSVVAPQLKELPHGRPAARR